ncbi:MAG TPA: sensor histidine kinase [Chloroflexia bacterium]|nr:sensor histidine kinase [Chloroflexia bacterium]
MREHVLTESARPRSATGVTRQGGRPWSVWLIPKPFDVVTTLLYLGTLLLFFYERLQGLYGHPLVWWQAVLIVAAILALLLVDRVEGWRYGEAVPARVAQLLFVTRLVLIEIVAQLDDFSFSPFLYLLIPFTAALYFGVRVGYGVAGLVWITYLVKISFYQVRWYSLVSDMHEVLIFSIGLIFAVTMAKVVQSEKESRARAEGLLRQVQAYTQQVEDLAVTKERNRLARDIHDSLGHYLTVINVQLEKALAFRAARPQEADLAVGDAKRLAREALQDVRGSVGALRTTAGPDAFVLGGALRQLAANMANSPFAIDVQIEGSEEDFAPGVRLALYRAAQEGLTNVQKHAAPGRVAVQLRFGPQAADLVLSDDGQGFEPASLLALPPGREGRYGLQGLRERLALVGGDLQIESRPGQGTRLRIQVPRDGLRPTGRPTLAPEEPADDPL